MEQKFFVLLEQRPRPLQELWQLLRLIIEDNARSGGELLELLLEELAEAGELLELLATMRGFPLQVAELRQPQEALALLKRSTSRRAQEEMLDSVDFTAEGLEQTLERCARLLTLKRGLLVLEPTWGIGKVQRIDDFNKRVIIDFRGKPAHAMSFAAVSQSVERAPAEHLLTRMFTAPEEMALLLQQTPAEAVKLALHSFGEQNLINLEEIFTRHKILQGESWRDFWERARRELRADPLVKLPSKRHEPLQLLQEPEDRTATWHLELARHSSTRDICQALEELERGGYLAQATAEQSAVAARSLAFALKGAHKLNDTLYARLALLAAGFAMLPAEHAHMRTYLLEGGRYLLIARDLSARHTQQLVRFLLEKGGDIAAELLDGLPQMNYNLLHETLSALKDDARAEAACLQWLTHSRVPPVLLNWVWRQRAALQWRLPPLPELLGQLFAVIEARFAGEELRMQNGLKELFEQDQWLRDLREEIEVSQWQLLFMRVQRSQGWDALTQRSIIGRMLQLDPSLGECRIKSEQPAAVARVTSWRSLSMKQRQYQELVRVELPQNSRDLAVARSYGDLRENFEYQAASEQQRILLQRQEDLQQDLEAVSGSDFTDIPCDCAAAGTMVTLRFEDGTLKRYTILGEWDRDEELDIISNKSPLALALLGEVAGARVTIPAVGGSESVTLLAIEPLSKEIREWLIGG